MKKIHKKAVVAEYLPWLIIAVVVLAVLVVFIFLLKNQGFSLVDKLKSLLRS